MMMITISGAQEITDLELFSHLLIKPCACKCEGWGLGIIIIIMNIIIIMLMTAPKQAILCHLHTNMA